MSSDYKFLWIDVSGKGSSSDAHIYNEMEFKEGLQNNDIAGFPEPDPPPGDAQDVPYFLVGDDAFGLRAYMMKPYANRDMTREQRIFNYRLSRARRVVENTFGILANRFQVLLTTMMHETDCQADGQGVRTPSQPDENALPDDAEEAGGLGASRWSPGAWREGRNLEDTRPDRPIDQQYQDPTEMSD